MTLVQLTDGVYRFNPDVKETKKLVYLISKLEYFIDKKITIFSIYFYIDICPKTPIMLSQIRIRGLETSKKNDYLLVGEVKIAW